MEPRKYDGLTDSLAKVAGLDAVEALGKDRMVEMMESSLEQTRRKAALDAAREILGEGVPLEELLSAATRVYKYMFD